MEDVGKDVIINVKEIQEFTLFLKQNALSSTEEYAQTWINRVFEFPLKGDVVLGDDTLNCASPFVVAAQYGHTAVVKLFLQKFSGALDVNHTATIVSLNTQNVVHGATALWCASTGNYVEIVEMLIEAGANVNKPTSTGSTPLRGAAFNGHCKVMEVLIKNGADLNLANVVGQSPLLIAVMRGHLKATELLLDKGADHSQCTIHNHSVIHLAAGKGHMEILQMLLDRGISPQFYLNHDHEHFKESACPALLAASTGKTEAVELLCSLAQCPPECESEAYLLLGATMAETNRRIFNGEVKEYWLRALQIREKCGYKPNFLPGFEAYGDLKELQSVEDLEKVFPYPFETEKWFSYQSLIIRERIMGRSDTGLIYYLVRRGIIYCRLNQHELAELIWRKAIKSMYRYSNKIAILGDGLVDGIQKDVNRDLMFIVDGIYSMTEDYLHEPAFSEFLEYILHHLDDVNKYSTKDESDFKVTLQLMLYLIYCWLRYDTYLMKDKAVDNVTWSEKCNEFGQRIVKTHLRSPKDSTLLHLAVSDFGIGGKSTFYTAVSKDTFDQLSLLLNALLHWGADDALYDMDEKGNRPIHIAMRTSHIKTCPNLAMPLIRHGCSPYIVNAAGEDALSLASKEIKEEVFSTVGPIPLFSQCCRTVIQHNLDYNRLPQHIKKHVSLFDKNAT